MSTHRYLRAAFGLLVVAAWLVFLGLTRVPAREYLLRQLHESRPGDVIDWRNPSAQLLLPGWWQPEDSYRWSASDALEVCVKPAAGAFDDGRIGLRLQVSALPQLVGLPIRYRLGADGPYQVQAVADGMMQIEAERRFTPMPSPVCLALELPLTVQPGTQDSRQLGIRLYQVTVLGRAAAKH